MTSGSIELSLCYGHRRGMVIDYTGCRYHRKCFRCQIHGLSVSGERGVSRAGVESRLDVEYTA